MQLAFFVLALDRARRTGIKRLFLALAQIVKFVIHLVATHGTDASAIGQLAGGGGGGDVARRWCERSCRRDRGFSDGDGGSEGDQIASSCCTGNFN